MDGLSVKLLSLLDNSFLHFAHICLLSFVIEALEA